MNARTVTTSKLKDAGLKFAAGPPPTVMAAAAAAACAKDFKGTFALTNCSLGGWAPVGLQHFMMIYQSFETQRYRNMSHHIVSYTYLFFILMWFIVTCTATASYDLTAWLKYECYYWPSRDICAFKEWMRTNTSNTTHWNWHSVVTGQQQIGYIGVTFQHWAVTGFPKFTFAFHSSRLLDWLAIYEHDKIPGNVPYQSSI